MNQQFMAALRTRAPLISLLLVLCVAPLTAGEPKTASLRGKIFRSDTGEPISGAVIILLDEHKSDKQDNSVESKTDDKGNYSFAKVTEGKYTVSLRSWYKTQEEAPCQILMAKTVEKNSTVVVAGENDRFVQQIFVKGFSIKAGKDNVKDFDFACKSMFEK